MISVLGYFEIIIRRRVTILKGTHVFVPTRAVNTHKVPTQLFKILLCSAGSEKSDSLNIRINGSRSGPNLPMLDQQAIVLCILFVFWLGYPRYSQRSFLMKTVFKCPLVVPLFLFPSTGVID